MIFHYAGKYNGDESSLPYKEHHPNATPFKEPEDTKKLSLIANGGCILIMGILAIPFLILGIEYIPDNAIWMMIGGICGGLFLLPHELLHAICYKKDVYMYNDLAHGLMFVVGTEDIAIMKERILNSSFTLIKYQRAQSTCCSFIDIKI